MGDGWYWENYTCQKRLPKLAAWWLEACLGHCPAPVQPEALLRNLALQLQINSQEDSAGAGDTQNIEQRKKNIGGMKYDEVASE